MPMFSKLKKRIQDEDSPQAANGSSTNLARVMSTDSLDGQQPVMPDGGGPPAPVPPNSGRVRRLEAKVQDLASMVRSRNQQIEEMQKKLDKQKADYELIIDKQRENHELQVEDAVESFRKELDSTNKELSEDEKERLERRYNKSTKEVEQYRAKYFRKDEESDEINNFVQQELAKVKHMLLNAEKELVGAQDELDCCKTELEATKRELDRARRECQLKGTRLEKVNEERAKDLEERRSQQTTIRALLTDKEELEKSLEDLNSQLTKTTSSLSNLERNGADSQERNAGLRRELEEVRAEAARAAHRAELREQELLERLSAQQTRLHDSKLDSFDARAKSLTEQRDRLEARLAEARSNLAESKTQLSAARLQSESVVSNMEARLQDAVSAEASAKDEVRHLEELLDKSHAEAAAKQMKYEVHISKLEKELNSKEQAHVRAAAEEESSQTELQALAESMQEQVEILRGELSAERQCNSSKLADYQRDLDISQKMLKEKIDLLEKIENEFRATREELTVRGDEADGLRSEKFSRELRLTELNSEVERLRGEADRWRRKVDSAKEEVASARDDARRVEEKLDRATSTWEQERGNWARRVEEQRAAAQAAEADVSGKTHALELQQLTTAELKEKLEELESERETVVVRVESAEVESLRGQVKNLQGQLEERNKTVRVQQSRIIDLKKTLQRELRVQALPNESSSQLSGGPTSGFSELSAQQQQQLGLAAAAVATAAGLQAVHSLPHLNGKSCGTGATSASALEECINVKYLKHVLLKFLLSRETEAVHLVRVITTLLRYNAEEERLIRQTLELRKNSWFSGKQAKQVEKHLSAAAGKGQHAKLIPPS